MTTPLLESAGVPHDLPEFVVGAHWLGERIVFACGDGSLRAFDGVGAEAWVREGVHEGGLLVSCAGFGADVLTGGDDGRIVSTDRDGNARQFAHFPNAWFEAIAASPATKQAAVGFGKTAAILGAAGEVARFAHPATVMGLAFEPNGRRIAAAHRDGVTLSWASNPTSRRKTLEWKGAHLSVIWSPDAKFVVTTMQENALHGWRLQDGQHFRMAGYPTKIRSLSFSSNGKRLATSGAPEVVSWPFEGPNGPIGSNADVAGELGEACAAVACHPTRGVLAAGGEDGEIVLLAFGAAEARPLLIDAPGGARVTALAWSADGRFLAFGCESGRAGVLDFTEALG